MTSTIPGQGRTLAQSLTIQTQVHLPGTVGRIIKQIRDIDRVAPLFREAGLIKPVDKALPLNLRVAGISAKSTIRRTVAGYLYASAAVRIDLDVNDNVVSTSGHDSICDLDDINYEDQSKQLQLLGIQQAYRLLQSALENNEKYDLIILDCPLLLNRSIVPTGESARNVAYTEAFNSAVETISSFWTQHKESIFPWKSDGPSVIGLANERYGAIVHIAQQDLRTREGRNQILGCETIDMSKLADLEGSESAISTIGERRFIEGIVGPYTRTAGFAMNVQTPRMEPLSVAKEGVSGFHFRAGHRTEARLIQLLGDDKVWTEDALNLICSQLMTLIAIGGVEARPLPILLADRELEALGPFLEAYGHEVQQQIRRRGVETQWLEDLEVGLGEEG